MEVRTACDRHLESCGDGQKTLPIGRALLCVEDLDPVQPVVPKTLDQVLGSAHRRMSENGQTTRTFDRGDDRSWRSHRLRNVERLASADQSVECGSCRRDVAGIDERTGDMRPTDATTRRSSKHVIKRYSVAGVSKDANELSCAVEPGLAQRREVREEALIRVVDKVAEDVDGAPVRLGGELDSRDDVDAESCSCAHGRSDTIDGVMVGNGNRLDAFGARKLDELGGTERAVRGRGVDV